MLREFIGSILLLPLSLTNSRATQLLDGQIESALLKGGKGSALSSLAKDISSLLILSMTE
jgi:hypothetical protein